VFQVEYALEAVKRGLLVPHSVRKLNVDKAHARLVSRGKTSSFWDVKSAQL
jgi:hypothetical protein